MDYTVISTPSVQEAYSDGWETTMTIDMKDEEGNVGREVWIVAGVPDYLRGESKAAGTQDGYRRVRVFGDRPEHWCPGTFLDYPAAGDEQMVEEVREAILEAVHGVALKAHRERING
jgi:hypothetical protein